MMHRIRRLTGRLMDLFRPEDVERPPVPEPPPPIEDEAVYHRRLVHHAEALSALNREAQGRLQSMLEELRTGEGR